jgi:hypothetical protein
MNGLVERLFPGARVKGVQLLSPDSGGDKVEGYGRPLKVTLDDGRVLVLRTATSNIFGHDRRSDRAQQMLLAYDTFGAMPDHVRALDVGAIAKDGELISLRDAGEFYLLTTFAEGRLYADHLRRIAAEGVATDDDLTRCESLARWIARLHRERIDEPASYTRAVRDLVGHGEGIFGMVDGYGIAYERLHAIERRCLEWRWRLRGREKRLCRIHGDFHPFNVVFDGLAFTLLDASRGCKGDAADDVTAMAINFVFFAIGGAGSPGDGRSPQGGAWIVGGAGSPGDGRSPQGGAWIDQPAAWPRGLGLLWRRFWDVYLRESGDAEVLDVLAPWLAWRALVVCSPRFYPHLPDAERDAILAFAERALDADRFDPASAEELFR